MPICLQTRDETHKQYCMDITKDIFWIFHGHPCSIRRAPVRGGSMLRAVAPSAAAACAMAERVSSSVKSMPNRRNGPDGRRGHAGQRTARIGYAPFGIGTPWERRRKKKERARPAAAPPSAVAACAIPEHGGGSLRSVPTAHTEPGGWGGASTDPRGVASDEFAVGGGGGGGGRLSGNLPAAASPPRRSPSVSSDETHF